MNIENEIEKYADMFGGFDPEDSKGNQMVVGLLIEIRNKLDELLKK